MRLASSAPSSAAGLRYAGIEGVRALAAIAVLVSHVWGNAPADGEAYGWGALAGVLLANLGLGVTVLFCLSGFLLYGPFARAILRGSPRPLTAAFARNRLLRILPLYWLVVVVVAALGLAWGADRALVHPDLPQLAAMLTLTNDLQPSLIGTGMPVAWTIPVELTFYAFLPPLTLLAVAGRARLGARAAALLPCAAILLLGLATKYLLLRSGAPDWRWPLESSFPCHADLFAFGMLLAVARTELEDGRMRLARGTRASAVAAGTVLTVWASLALGDHQHTANPWNVVAGAGLALMLAPLVLPGGRAPRLLAWRPMAAVGVASYSLALWHEPVIDGLRAAGLTANGAAGLGWNIALTLAVSIPIALASYRFVEAPLLARKRSMRRVSRPLPAPPGTPPAAPRPARPASSASCLPSASPAASASG